MDPSLRETGMSWGTGSIHWSCKRLFSYNLLSMRICSSSPALGFLNIFFGFWLYHSYLIQPPTSPSSLYMLYLTLWFHLVWSVLSYDPLSGNVLVSVLPNCRSLSYHFAFSWERVRVCICTSKRESDIRVGLSSLVNSFFIGWWPDCRTGDLWVSCIPLAN